MRFRRSTPDNKHAVVVATATDDTSATRYVLDRVHGKLGNVWRDALIRASGGALSKREARDLIGWDAAELATRVVDLPRHRLAELVRTGFR